MTHLDPESVRPTPTDAPAPVSDPETGERHDPEPHVVAGDPPRQTGALRCSGCGRTEAQHGPAMKGEVHDFYVLALPDPGGPALEPADPDAEEATRYVSVSVVLEDGIQRSMMWACGPEVPDRDLLAAACAHLGEYLQSAAP